MALSFLRDRLGCRRLLAMVLSIVTGPHSLSRRALPPLSKVLARDYYSREVGLSQSLAVTPRAGNLSHLKMTVRSGLHPGPHAP